MEHKVLLAGWVSLLIAGTVEGAAVRVDSQLTIVTTQSTMFNYSQGSLVGSDVANLEDSIVGNHLVSTNAELAYQGISHVARASHQASANDTFGTVTLGGTAELDLSFNSEEIFHPDSLETNSDVQVMLDLVFVLSEPRTYTLTLQPQGAQTLAGLATFNLLKDSLSIISAAYTFNTEQLPPQFSGHFEAGSYRLSFSASASAYGFVGPDISNPPTGRNSVAWMLALHPYVTPELRPRLSMLPDFANGRMVIRIADLVPGRLYFIRRSTVLNPSPWLVVHNFSAAGTEVIWSDSFSIADENVFYQVSF